MAETPSGPHGCWEVRATPATIFTGSVGLFLITILNVGWQHHSNAQLFFQSADPGQSRRAGTQKPTSLISQQFPRQFPLPAAGRAQVGRQRAAEAIRRRSCPSLPSPPPFLSLLPFSNVLGCATWRVVSWFLTRDQICALQWKCGVLTTDCQGSPHWPLLIPDPPTHFTRRFLNRKISGRGEMEEAGPKPMSGG